MGRVLGKVLPAEDAASLIPIAGGSPGRAALLAEEGGVGIAALVRALDDPDLRIVGDHPVIFVGAGSHSGAFVPGQYLVSVNPVRLRPVLRSTRRVKDFAFPFAIEGRNAVQLHAEFGDNPAPFVPVAGATYRVRLEPKRAGKWRRKLFEYEWHATTEHVGNYIARINEAGSTIEEELGP